MHIPDLRVNALRYAWVPSARLVEVKIYKYNCETLLEK